MNYLDVYFSRINHLGETTAERIRNGGIRSFEKWLAERQKLQFNKTNDNKNSPVETIGTLQEEKKVNGTFKSFWIVRCNYFMKWIDSNGHLQTSWAYFVSSLDSKIKGNFRTWNNLITPQPNKYAEILMPYYLIDRATNFIVEDESWTVVEYDRSSVPGIIYLSLTETKVNAIYDDTLNDIADLDKLAVYELSVPEVTQIFSIGEPINLVFTLMKNGIPSTEEVEFISTDKKIAKIVEIDGEKKLIGVSEGTVDIIIQLKNYPSIQKIINITIGTESQEFSAYIEGNDSLRLDRINTYILKGTEDISGEVIFSIDDITLAKIIAKENNQCEVRANNKNKLGKIILSAQYNDKTYTKEISIIPLW